MFIYEEYRIVIQEVIIMMNYYIDENGYVCEVMDNTNECLGEYQDRNYVETTIMAIEVFENDKETK